MIQVFSVKIQTYQSYDYMGRVQYGSEIIVEFRKDTLGHQFAMSRVNYQLANTKHEQENQRLRFLERAAKWH